MRNLVGTNVSKGAKGEGRKGVDLYSMKKGFAPTIKGDTRKGCFVLGYFLFLHHCLVLRNVLQNLAIHPPAFPCNVTRCTANAHVRLWPWDLGAVCFHANSFVSTCSNKQQQVCYLVTSGPDRRGNTLLLLITMLYT